MSAVLALFPLGRGWLWRALTAAICLSPLGGASALALNFQIHLTTVVDDGITKQQKYLEQDASTIIYITFPPDWTYTDDASSIRLVSPGSSGDIVRLQVSPFRPDLPFKDHGLVTYQKQALAQVPSGATAVQVAEQHDNPLPIMHWQSHEFILSYEFFGHSYRLSALFVDLNAKEQILATTTAITSDFDATRTAGLDVLRSWQLMPVR